MMAISWRDLRKLNYGDVVTALFVLLAFQCFRLLWEHFVLRFWWRPLRIKRIFQQQGIRILDGHFLTGNASEIASLISEALSQPMPDISHDIVPRVLPHFHKWSSIYGYPFVHWFGSQARFFAAEPELCKEILSTKHEYFLRPEPRSDTKYFIGEGILSLNGEAWAHRRHIMNPAFYYEKLKAMVPTMISCTLETINKWDALVDKHQEIDVQEEFTTLTADIIAHTAFGTSYAEGKQVFELQLEQQFLFQAASRKAYIPGSWLLPTGINRRQWQVNRRLNHVLNRLVKKRFESSSYGDDLLGLMMASNKGQLKGNRKNLTMGTNEIINECKTIFLAGHETTATLLTWTMMLLATNPKWQEQAREEVIAECGTEPPTVESLQRLKIVGMVLNEALRLYPPAVVLFRTAACDMKIGDITVPRGTEVLVPILLLHHDKRYWGPDANEFNPNRFSDGVAKASGAFMPFSMGPRICIGQTFALFEAKVALSSVLQRFKFCLHPNYCHAPALRITLKSKHGMPMIFERL